LKSYWLDHRVRLNTAAFYSKYEDMQITYPIDPTNVAKSQVLNAGKASIKGIEIELLVQPIDDLSLNLNYSYLSADLQKVDVVAGSVFDRNANTASPYAPGDNISDLFVLPHVPKNSFDLSADYTFLHFDSGSASAVLNYRWQDKSYFVAAGGPLVPGRDFDAQGAYGLLNGRITLALDLPRGDHAKISLWGKNLANKKYVLSAIPQGGVAVPVGSNPAGYNSAAVAWSEPTSYGLDLTYEY
jgi:iron complex outermembrane recepter protein